MQNTHLNRNCVVVGLSGGVDSAVTASLLQQEGFEVFGLAMELYSCDRPLHKGCCTPADRLDARKICEQLHIPFETIDLRPLFQKQVMEYFAREYALGRTPLPCAPCNKEVRFKALLDYADSKRAYWIATGHYARVLQKENGMVLMRAKDLKKDQSYFLWGLEKETLSRLMLPLGEWTKKEVRRRAGQLGLPVAEKKDSQELCFLGETEVPEFLETHFPKATFPAGDFVDGQGNLVGKHRGVHAYTIGQRRGLGISLGERRYVVALRPQNNEVVLGPRDRLVARGLVAGNLHWNETSPATGKGPLTVKIRSTHSGTLATLKAADGECEVWFEKPQEAITPGQAVVFYDGEDCVGGGWIERAIE